MYLYTVQRGSTTPHPFSSWPLFVCKNLVAKGALKFLRTWPRDLKYFTDAYVRTVRPADLHNF